MPAPISRTRGGCWACRQKRVKCDESRPVCSRCAKNNVSCNYGMRLVWREESLARGVCHGRTGVWSKRDGRATGRDEKLRQQQQKGSQRQSPPDSPSGGRASLRRRHSSKASAFLNTTVDDIRLYFDYDYLGDHEKDPATDSSQLLLHSPVREAIIQEDFCLTSPSPWLGLGARKFRPTFDYDYALLSHYEAVICSSSTLQDDVYSNPYRHLILPMAMQSEGLYHAVLAISANILRLTDLKYHVAALEHRQKALKMLITVLNKGDWSDQEIDEALGLVLILCWFEISDSCSSSWVTHLDGLWRLLRQKQRPSSALSSHSESLARFFHKYFTFHLVLARTAFHVDNDVRLSNLESALAISSSPFSSTPGLPSQTDIPSRDSANSHTQSPSASSKPTELLLLNMPPESHHIIDQYMGFSNALLLLINEVADLAWQDPVSEASENVSDLHEQLQARVFRLKADLENLKQTAPSQHSDPDHTPTYISSDQRSDSEVVTIAEAYRLGALLLLHEICSPTSRPTGNVGTLNCGNRLPHLPADEKQRYVDAILHLIVRSPIDVMRTASSPLWPLFLAGCCATGDEQRITVLKVFEQTESMRRFGNITPAREVVEMVWRQRDLAVQDERKRNKHHGSPVTARANATANRPNSTAPAAGNVIGTQSAKVRHNRVRAKRFEWERAMAMLGGRKLSLT